VNRPAKITNRDWVDSHAQIGKRAPNVAVRQATARANRTAAQTEPNAIEIGETGTTARANRTAVQTEPSPVETDGIGTTTLTNLMIAPAVASGVQVGRNAKTAQVGNGRAKPHQSASAWLMPPD